jgi:hypothetical protein
MVILAQDFSEGNRAATTDPNVVIVAEWPLSRGDRAPVSIEKFNNAWLINLRKWYEADDGQLRPGRHGIALGIKHLPQLAEAITDALSLARERGILPPSEGEGGVSRGTSGG